MKENSMKKLEKNWETMGSKLLHSDIGDEQDRKNNWPFAEHCLITSTDHIFWKKKLGDLQKSW